MHLTIEKIFCFPLSLYAENRAVDAHGAILLAFSKDSIKWKDSVKEKILAIINNNSVGCKMNFPEPIKFRYKKELSSFRILINSKEIMEINPNYISRGGIISPGSMEELMKMIVFRLNNQINQNQ